MTDRLVHAVMKDGSEVVRYNRAGKWCQEWPDGSHPTRSLLLRDAVSLALEAASVQYGLSGGGAFDRSVKTRLWAMEQGDHS